MIAIMQIMISASVTDFRKLPTKRKIAVDMLELGEYSKELHEKVGKEVVRNKNRYPNSV